MEDLLETVRGEELYKIMQELHKIAATQYETDYLDNADMKLIFKVSDKTLYRWRKKQELLCQKIGGKYYYSKKVLYTTLYQRLLNQYPHHKLPKLF